jgi:hypothetical protein
LKLYLSGWPNSRLKDDTMKKVSENHLQVGRRYAVIKGNGSPDGYFLQAY